MSELSDEEKKVILVMKGMLEAFDELIREELKKDIGYCLICFDKEDMIDDYPAFIMHMSKGPKEKVAQSVEIILEGMKEFIKKEKTH